MGRPMHSEFESSASSDDHHEATWLETATTAVFAVLAIACVSFIGVVMSLS